MYIYCTNYHVTVLERIFIVTIRLGGASVSDTRPSAKEAGELSLTARQGRRRVHATLSKRSPSAAPPLRRGATKGSPPTEQ